MKTMNLLMIAAVFTLSGISFAEAHGQNEVAKSGLVSHAELEKALAGFVQKSSDQKIQVKSPTTNTVESTIDDGTRNVNRLERGKYL